VGIAGDREGGCAVAAAATGLDGAFWYHQTFSRQAGPLSLGVRLREVSSHRSLLSHRTLAWDDDGEVAEGAGRDQGGFEESGGPAEAKADSKAWAKSSETSRRTTSRKASDSAPPKPASKLL
jgi:hypothetical protein